MFLLQTQEGISAIGHILIGECERTEFEGRLLGGAPIVTQFAGNHMPFEVVGSVDYIYRTLENG